jgi:ABC-type transport system involved in multi-copper enzyme maturation permease subunit
MFASLFLKELRENIRNFRFLLALLLCLILIPLGFTVSQKDYAERRKAYDQTVQDYEQSRKTVLDLWSNGGSAFRPPAPLGLISEGVEMVLPNSVETRGYISDQGAQVQFNTSRRVENPFAALFGRLDLAFIVSTVLAVLVMIFSFNAIAGEKERRTLAQIMANSVPRSTVVAAKMAAGASLLGTAFLAGTAAGLLVTIALGLSPFSRPETALPFAVAIGVSLLFLAGFLALGLLVSALSRSSISAMITLLAVWVGLAMVLPKASVVASRLLLPVRSQQVVDLEKAQVRAQSGRELETAVRELARTSPGVQGLSASEYFKRKNASDPTVADYEERQTELNAEFAARLNTQLDRIDAEFERQRARQAALARNLSRLSPVSCFIHVLAEVAGTGFVEESAWRSTRSRFKQLLDREIAPKTGARRFGDVTYGKLDLDRNAPAPRLAAESVPLERRLAAVWIDLALLGVYGLLFFAGAHVAFLRYDVR